MKSAEKVWNRLPLADRERLLRLLWQSEDIVAIEAKRKWRQILPSTTDKLLRMDWKQILGKELT